MSGSQSPHNYLEPLVQIRIKTEPETERKDIKDQQQESDDQFEVENQLSKQAVVPSTQSNEDLTNKSGSNSTAELNVNNDSTKKGRASRSKNKKYRCAICPQRSRDERTFFVHLKCHYVPKKGEQFQCSVCRESFKAQVDYFLHLRQHYEPSLMSELGNAITVVFKPSDAVEAMNVDDLYNEQHNDNGRNYQYDDDDFDLDFDDDENISRSDFEDELRTDFKQEEGDYFKPEVTQKEKSSKIKIERAEDENKKKFTCPLCSRSKLSTSLEAFNESHVCPKNPNKKRGKKVYVCSICEKSCRDVVDWRRHELTHSNERPFACEMCGKTYKAERLLKDHLAGHTALIDCEFCQLKIEGTDNYKEHVKLVHQEKVGCTVCRMTFLGQKRLENHMRIHSSEKQFVCEICGVSYPFQKSLFNHMNLVHKEIGDKSKLEEEEEEGEYSCPDCSVIFTLKRFLNTHCCSKRLERIEKKCQCDICGRAFSKESYLVKHKKIHTDDKPFKCDFCPRTYKYVGDLRKHLTFHTGEPIKCEFCEKLCQGHAKYQQHIKAKHRYKFECHECKKEFSRKTSLESHMRMHTNEKPFVCTDCGAAYPSLSSLCFHRKNAHSDVVREKNVHCEICGRSFYSNNALMKHKAGFHNENKDQLCTECGAAFKNKHELKKHLIRHNKPDIPCHLCSKLFNTSENYRRHLKRTHYRDRETEEEIPGDIPQEIV